MKQKKRGQFNKINTVKLGLNITNMITTSNKRPNNK